MARLIEEEVGGTVRCDADAPPVPVVADVSHERARRDFGYELTPLRRAIREHAELAREHTP